MSEIYFDGKPIIITVHAIRREREIACPDQVYNAIMTRQTKRFGKKGIKFASKGKKDSIICIGEDLGNYIIIKTVERGN